MLDDVSVLQASKAAAVLLAFTLCCSACAADDGGGSDNLPEVDTSSTASSGSAERIAQGCGLVRGESPDGTTRHYSDLAAHALFRAVLAAEPGQAMAARLWAAADRLLDDDSAPPRSALLRMCTDAGFVEPTGMIELRAFACDVNSRIALERPDIGAYGPEDTEAAPGDPLRTDVEFLDVTFFLLSMKESPEWLDAEALGVALESEDDASYKASLDHFDEMCARAPSRGR